jgi:hypothetical protein
MAKPSRPTSTTPDDYAAWRAYIADFTGFKGAKLTQATREAISSERAKAKGDGGGSANVEPPKEDLTGPGKPQDPNRPGQAWEWDGSKWVKPTKPTTGDVLWDDAQGWVEDTEKIAGRNNAREALSALLEEYGLRDLLPVLEDLLTEFGGNETIIMSRLRQSDPYKKRFAGNELRRQAGLAAITEGDYLAMEREYTKVMRSYGIDSSYYSMDSLAGLIGGDVSELEVQQRIDAGKRMLDSADSAVLREFQEYYPQLGEGDLLTYLLDPKKGQEVLSQKIRTAQIGGAAEGQGFQMGFEQSDLLSRSAMGQTLDPFDARTQAQLQSTFAQAGRTARRERTLSAIDQEDYTEFDTLQAAFGDEQKQLASERRGKRERARFSGTAGASRSALSQQRNF